MKRDPLTREQVARLAEGEPPSAMGLDHEEAITAMAQMLLKPIRMPEQIYVREPGFIGWVYDADEVEAMLKSNGLEVIE